MTDVAVNLPPADRTGVARVWEIPLTPEAVEAHRREWGSEHAAAGSSWFVNGPYHLMWSWWFVGCVHLREAPGVRPPVIHYPGATHEICCFSLDPSGVPDIAAIRNGDITSRPGFLSPADWIVQFIVASDEQAAELTKLAVTSIADGQSCDSDFRGYWERLIHRTAEHLRLGGHPS